MKIVNIAKGETFANLNKINTATINAVDVVE